MLHQESSKVFVASASSDIGGNLVQHFLEKGCEVFGTYRTHTPRVSELEEKGAKLYAVNVNSEDEVLELADKLIDNGFEWDTFISAVGVLDPIAPFFSNEFSQWEKSVITNSTAQLRMLHAIHKLRSKAGVSKVIFFAGGGTNSSFDNYSAYCIGKISLIKMTELLHSEYADLQVSIIGTGWVNTKIHNQTLGAGVSAGDNLLQTQEFLQNSNSSDNSSIDTVIECIDWCLSAPRDAVGGRNFSMVHDIGEIPTL